jgi:hypothetical protein
MEPTNTPRPVRSRPLSAPGLIRFIGAFATVLLTAAELSGCALYSPPPATTAAIRERPDTTDGTAILTWQSQLGQYIAGAGAGDPAVLSQLPALRSPAVVRPGQIVFAATDVEATSPERDGDDVFGLLLGKQVTAAGPLYVFIVGAVERQDYWPVAITDVRVAVMSVNGGVVTWQTGPASVEALKRYRRIADTSTMLRFPAERDQFRLIGCDPGVCVEELRSGARWALYLDAVTRPANSTTPSAPSVSATH